MSRFARLDSAGRVVELICIPADGPALAELFHADLAAQLIPVSPEVAEGWLWDGASFAEPVIQPGPTAEEVRARRDALLLSSDRTQLMDAPLSRAKRAEWAAYRRALRELPEQAGFPSAVIWPDAPGD